MCSSTEIIHSIPVDPLTGSIATPVNQTSTFVQEAPGVNKGFDYARSNNPTRKVLEDLIAKLEGGDAGFAFATRLAVIDSVIKLLKAGDEIVAVDDIYGGAFRLFTHVYEKFGIKIHYLDTTDADNILDYINDKTRLVWIESPTNPTLKVSDIRKIANIAKCFNALLVVDNTCASPVTQKPIELGADIVIHSGTKYITGHSDLVAGIVVTKTEALSEMYNAYPESKAAMANSYGYAAFANLGMNLGVVSSGNGGGKAHNNSTGAEVYVKMISYGAGVGIGAKKYFAVFLFANKMAFDNFLESGWSAEGAADATADTGNEADGGGSISAGMSVADGVTLYQIADKGFAIQATVQGTKFVVSPELNGTAN